LIIKLCYCCSEKRIPATVRVSADTYDGSHGKDNIVADGIDRICDMVDDRIVCATMYTGGGGGVGDSWS